MKEIIAKLLNDLVNFKTLTVVMFVILSILLMNNMIHNDNTIFYITSYSVISLCYIYNGLNNNLRIKQEINIQ